MNSFAHLTFALALSETFGGMTVIIALSSLAPDLDFYLTHRGIMHNPFFALFLIAIIPRYKRSFALGYLSHLFLDAFTPMGIPILLTKFTLNRMEAEPFVILLSLAVIFSTKLQAMLRQNKKLAIFLTSIFFLSSITPTVAIMPPARIILEEPYGAVITYGHATKLPLDFASTVHENSALSLNGYTLKLSKFSCEGFVFVKGYYNKKTKRLERVSPASILG